MSASGGVTFCPSGPPAPRAEGRACHKKPLARTTAGLSLRERSRRSKDSNPALQVNEEWLVNQSIWYDRTGPLRQRSTRL